MTETVTKTIFANCPASKLFRFLANAENWPQWAIHNVLAIRPGNDGWWLLETPQGPGRLRIRANERQGILDHEFIDAQECRWDVPARVVAVEDGSLFMLTLRKPGPMPTDVFEIGMKLLDEELAVLKRVVEDDSGGTADSSTLEIQPVGGVKRVKVKNGMNDSFEAMFAELQAKVRESEPGTVYYDLFGSRTDPDRYFVLEKYQSHEAWVFHQQSPHGNILFPQIRVVLDDLSVEYFDELGGL